jgi:membrane fusion protein, multidrug efflux system
MAYRGTGIPARQDEPLNKIQEAPKVDEKPTRHRTRNIAVAVVVAIVILLIVLVRNRTPATTSAQAGAAGGKGRATPVAVAVVEQRDVPVYLDGLGNVNALNTVNVKTRIDGQLLRFNFQEGQVVRADEELAVIDPRPSEAQLAQAEAALFKDEANLENARRDLQRYSDLYKSGVIPQQQYNTQQSQVRVDEGAIKSDEAQIQQAKLNVNYCHIKAPITGRVGIRNVDPGNIVHASDANGLVVITQMQPIAVLFTLPEDSLPAITQKRSATLPVEAWSRDSTQLIARGRLLTIDNQIDPNTGTFRCKAIFDNANTALFPNQFVNSRLMVDVRHNATVVPAVAVQHGAAGTYVYIVRPDATVDAQPVTVALLEGTSAVVTGVNPGDRVVTDGADKLQPHAKVEIAGAGGRGAGGGGGGGPRKGGAPRP